MINRKKSTIATFLKEYKGPCPSCGYQLNKPESNRCPECGSWLHVVLQTPFTLSPWNAMLAGVAISIGVILDRVVLTSIGVAGSNQGRMVWEMFWFSFVPLVFLVVCFFAVWKHKSKINSSVKWKRILWYIAAVIFPIVVAIAQLVGLIWLVWQN
jgi:hypothetical protein